MPILLAENRKPRRIHPIMRIKKMIDLQPRDILNNLSKLRNNLSKQANLKYPATT